MTPLLATALLATALPDDSLEALWRDASRWRAGDDVALVDSARARLVASGGLAWVLEHKLNTVEHLKVYAVKELVKSAEGAADSLVLAALSSSDSATRWNAVYIAGEDSVATCEGALLRALGGTTDPFQRAALFRALGKLRSTRGARAAVSALGDTSLLVRVKALNLIGRTAYDSALAAVTARFADDEAPVRYAAAKAAAKLPSFPPSAAGLLTRPLVSRKDTLTAATCLSALAFARSGESAVAPAERFLASESPRLRLAALRVLEAHGCIAPVTCDPDGVVAHELGRFQSREQRQ